MNVEEKMGTRVLFSDGTEASEEETLLREYSLRIFADGQERLQCVCTETALRELAVGRLFTEGILNDIDELEACEIREEEHRADVRLRARKAAEVPSGIKEPYAWKKEWIFRLAKEFAGDTLLHRRTACTHSCFLAQEDRFLWGAEDIGRHNAVDKVLGWALLNRVDLGRSILYTSGRVPVDMMEKILRAGVPLAVSNAAPTGDAVLLAEKYGVTLIGRTRPDRIRVYTAI